MEIQPELRQLVQQDGHMKMDTTCTTWQKNQRQRKLGTALFFSSVTTLLKD